MDCYKCGKTTERGSPERCICECDDWHRRYVPFLSLAGQEALREHLFKLFPKAKKHHLDNIVMYCLNLHLGEGRVRIAKNTDWPFKGSVWHTYRKAETALKLMQQEGFVELKTFNYKSKFSSNWKRLSVLFATEKFIKELEPLLKMEEVELEQKEAWVLTTPVRFIGQASDIRVGEMPSYFTKQLWVKELKRMRSLNETYFSKIDVDHPTQGHKFQRPLWFSRRFNEGKNGRIYPVGWSYYLLNQRRDKQRDLLTIDGEATESIDVCGCHITIQMAEQGFQFDGDPYGPLVEALPQYTRQQVKDAYMFAMNCADEKQFINTCRPNGIKKAKLVLEKMREVYPQIEFFTGRANELMFLESEWLLDTLETLAEMGIPALPLHDELRVKKSDVQKTREVAARVFERHFGVTPMMKKEC